MPITINIKLRKRKEGKLSLKENWKIEMGSYLENSSVQCIEYQQPEINQGIYSSVNLQWERLRIQG